MLCILIQENSLGNRSTLLSNGVPTLELPPDHNESSSDPHRPRSSTIGSGEAMKKDIGPSGGLSAGSSQPQLNSSLVPASPGSPQPKQSEMMNMYV